MILIISGKFTEHMKIFLGSILITRQIAQDQCRRHAIALLVGAKECARWPWIIDEQLLKFRIPEQLHLILKVDPQSPRKFTGVLCKIAIWNKCRKHRASLARHPFVDALE